MVLSIWLVTFGLYALSYGQDVEFQYDSKCFKESDTMTVTATYIPSGAATVDFVNWYYSGQLATNLIIDVSTCTVFGSIPSGYPDASRMSYDCPSTNSNLNANTFKLSLTGLTGDELDDSWGATFTLSVGTDPALVQESISKCIATTTDGQTFAYWKIVIIIIVAVLFTTTVAGCCLDCFCSDRHKRCFDCEASDCCKCCQCCDNNCVRCKCCGSCCNIDGLPFWYHILWWTVIGTPVSLGIFISRKCRKQAEKPGDSERNEKSDDL